MDGDGSLLDKTLIIWGSPMADPNIHNHRRCPLVLFGKANGALKGNLHLKAADGTPMANVMLTLLHQLGIDDMKTFGDSTGEFSFTRAGDDARSRTVTAEHAEIAETICSAFFAAWEHASMRTTDSV